MKIEKKLESIFEGKSIPEIVEIIFTVFSVNKRDKLKVNIEKAYSDFMKKAKNDKDGSGSKSL